MKITHSRSISSSHPCDPNPGDSPVRFKFNRETQKIKVYRVKKYRRLSPIKGKNHDFFSGVFILPALFDKLASYFFI